MPRRAYSSAGKLAIAIGLFAGLCTTPTMAQSTQPTAEEVMQKAVDAMGGADAIKKIKSRSLTGTYSMPAANVSGTLKMLQKDKVGVFSMDIAGQGKSLSGFDGTTAWSFSTTQGPRILEGAEREETLRQFDILADLNWKDAFEKVELSGKEIVGNSDAYKLVLTSKAGKVETRFYDAKSYMLVKSLSSTESPMGKIQTESVFSDFKEVDGLTVPAKMTVNIAGYPPQIFTFDKIEQNVNLADSEFAPPAEVKELVAAKAKEVKP